MTFVLKSFWAHFQSKLQLSIFFLNKADDQAHFSKFSGPNLPYGISGAAMVTFPNASRLIHIGGYCGIRHEYCDKIWELVTSNPMKWVALDQKLESARYGHVAMAYLIPDELTCCKLIDDNFAQPVKFRHKKRARIFKDPRLLQYLKKSNSTLALECKLKLKK